MKYIKIRKDVLHTSGDTAALNPKTMQWEPAKPHLMSFEFSMQGIKEWFVHTILRKHFSYGQPYCVVCGYAEDKDN